jgi:cell division protein FtsN
MSRDYKAKPRAGAQRKSGSSLLVGLLIGLVLGLVVALGVAWYINKMPSPFTPRSNPAGPPAKFESSKSSQTQTAKVDEKASAKSDGVDKGEKSDSSDKSADKGGGKGGDKAVQDKPRFDFYKILPGSEEAAPEKSGKDAAKGSTPATKEAFFLQAGSFQNAPDADNLKATLALLGYEAAIETTTLPDKGVWHRVRIGPYTSVEELNRTREALKRSGVQTALVKAREPER